MEKQNGFPKTKVSDKGILYFPTNLYAEHIMQKYQIPAKAQWKMVEESCEDGTILLAESWSGFMKPGG